MSSAQQYCLRWNNHSSNFITVFEQLLRTEAFTDVTVAVHDGTAIKCHKMVLAACSSYFQDLFIKNPCEHPIIILSEVKYTEIKAILDYMYRGEVNVAQDQLAGLLKVAAFLKVKGLVEDTENNRREDGDTDVSPPPAISTSTTNSQTHSSGYVSPTHISSSTFIPYGKSPIERNHNHIPLWTAFSAALPLPQHPISGPPPRSQHSILGTSYDSTSETSPLSRKKLSALMANRDTPILRNVLGQGQVDSPAADRQDGSFCSNSNGSLHDSDRRNSAELSETMMEEDEIKCSPPYPNVNGTGKPTTTTKPEWKRYKQYTREHIHDAMEAVRNKEMSALQAARRYGVPSRTLYDKLKKAGILPSRGLGISRQREPSSVTDNGSARFPYSSSVNGSVYGCSALSESESETNGLHNGSLVMDMSTRSPSPARSSQLFVSPAIVNDDQVEDLSIARSSSSSTGSSNNATPVIVPAATITAPIKQEQQDASEEAV